MDADRPQLVSTVHEGSRLGAFFLPNHQKTGGWTPPPPPLDHFPKPIPQSRPSAPPPLAGLLFLIVLGTGLVDWTARRR